MKIILERIVPVTLISLMLGACNVPVDSEEAASTVPSALTLSGGTVVTLKNACGGKLLDIESESGADGARALTWTSTGGANQQFSLGAAGGGAFALLARHSGKALDVLGAATTSGSAVAQWTANGQPNQSWVFTANADGTYRISPSHASKLALAVDSTSGATGAAAIVQTIGSSCAQRWTVGAVSGTPTTPTTPTTPPSSGTSLPIGDLPGWKQTLAQDFTTAASAGSAFASTYAASWCGYDDNSIYKQSNLSAAGGNMVVTLTGSAGAAGVFAPGGCASAWKGTVYGRYSMRFKAVNAAGNGTATMVWPVSDIWGDGEIDYPEGNFDGTIGVFHHGVGCNDCSAADGLDTGVTFRDWHIATTEWSPGKVVYYLDGKVIKTVTHDVPTTPHRFTMQAAPVSSSAKSGQFLIDWVAVYTKN